MAVDSHLALVNDALERCRLAFAAVEAARNDVQQGVVDNDLAFYSAVDNLMHAFEHFNLVNNNARRYFRRFRRIRMGQVWSNRHPTADEPAPIRPAVDDIRSVAAHHTVVEPAPVRPVAADVLEEQNTAAPEETGPELRSG